MIPFDNYPMRISQRQYTVASSLPLGAILGLAIGGAVLFLALALLSIYLARRKDRYKRKNLKDLNEKPTEVKHSAEPTARNSSGHPRRLSLNPFLHAEPASVLIPNGWLEDNSMMDPPPMTKAQAKRFSQKGFFQIPKIRDSWPLATSMPMVPLRLFPSNSSMVILNQAGGGGYVVPVEPQRPGRTYSRNSKSRILVSAERSSMERFSAISDEVASKPEPKRPTDRRRSASVSHLSTILRSTSQRLKAAHRETLTRSVTIGGSMGPPPSEKLRTPKKLANGSQEGLTQFEGDDAETVASSICNISLPPSPSPAGKRGRDLDQGALQRMSPSAPSAESIDSLCTGTTPEIMIPAALTSPSKRLKKSSSPPVFRMSSNTEDFPALIHGEGRAAALELSPEGSHTEMAAFTSPHQTSQASDPFYSAGIGGKRVVQQNKIIGPRPLSDRETKFDEEASSDRPASFVALAPSPLCIISGNMRSSSRVVSSDSFDAEPVANPFKWEPRYAKTTPVKQTPPRVGPRRRGHQRSQTGRISFSILPATNSFPEGREEEHLSPLKFKVPENTPMRASDPTKSPSPKPSSVSSRRLSTRPPSIAFFNPVVSVPESLENDQEPSTDSPTLGFNVPSQIYTPNSAASYNTEGRASKEGFHKAMPVESENSSSNRHRKRTVTNAFPLSEYQELFPPSAHGVKKSPRISLSPPRVSKSTRNRSPASPILPNTSQVLSAPPLLTQNSFIPSHLNGPRPQNTKRLSKGFNDLRDSTLHESISKLRRMNSEISQISLGSTEDEEGRRTPRLTPAMSSDFSDWGRLNDRQRRGSQAYLSMGVSDNGKKSRVSKHQSNRRDKISSRRTIREDDIDGLAGWEPKDLHVMTEEHESLDSSRWKQGKDILETNDLPSHGSRSSKDGRDEILSTKDSFTTQVVTPSLPRTSSPLKSVRWSDATPSPTIKVVRHESQLLEPSPQTLPGWTESNLRKLAIEDAEDAQENIPIRSPTRPGKRRPQNWNSTFGHRGSLGLYDADGFLRSSPERGSGKK